MSACRLPASLPEAISAPFFGVIFFLPLGRGILYILWLFCQQRHMPAGALAGDLDVLRAQFITEERAPAKESRAAVQEMSPSSTHVLG